MVRYSDLLSATVPSGEPADPGPDGPLAFDASYVYAKDSFCILGLDAPLRRDDDLYPLFCVAQNLICRGAPTPPSARLTEALGPLPADAAQRPRLVHAPSGDRWGASQVDSFSRRLLELVEELLPESRRYAVGLIATDVPLSFLVPGEGSVFEGQSVALYCPRARMAIEVDGAVHAHEPQRSLDAQRDRFLGRHGLFVARVPAADLHASSDAVQRAVNNLVVRLGEDRAPAVWERVAGDAGWNAIASYETVMRYQVLLCELLRRGILDLRAPAWHLHLTSDVLAERQEHLFRIAWADLREVLENLARLRGWSLPDPVLWFDELPATLRLDVGAAVWNTSPEAEGAVRVRSSCFEDLDRFSLASAAPIPYRTCDDANRVSVEDALRFFLRYLFGRKGFLPGQQGIARTALALRPTLGSLPAKEASLQGWALACLLQPAPSLAVDPSKSQAQNQMEALRAAGIDRIGCFDDTASTAAEADALNAGRRLLEWVTPERLQQDEGLRHMLASSGSRRPWGYAVVDEARWDAASATAPSLESLREACPGATLLGMAPPMGRVAMMRLANALGAQATSVVAVPESIDAMRATFVDEQPGRPGEPRAFTLVAPEELDRILRLCEHWSGDHGGDLVLEWTTLMARLLTGGHGEGFLGAQCALVAEAGGALPPAEGLRLLEATLEVAALGPSEARDALGAQVVRLLPSQAQRAYERLGDNVTLRYLLDEAARRLQPIWGGFDHA